MQGYWSKAASVCVAATMLLGVAQAQARDTALMLPINDVVSEYSGKLNSDVALYFGKQAHSSVSKQLGEFTTNKKTNAFGKSDQKACKWVMLSALLSLQERAVREGGNAVVNIRSYYDKNEKSSTSNYECHAGAFVAGVALKGRVVKLK